MKTIFKHTLLSLALLTEAFTAQAQVKIGDSPTTINPGSVLELESTNKGLLLPRINLANTTTWGLAGTAVAGMHVYNTNNGITSTNANYPTLVAKIGEYYWDGTGWVALAPVGRTANIIYSGFRAAEAQYVEGQPSHNQVTVPQYNPFGAYSGGVFTVPFDGWFVIAHNWQVDFHKRAEDVNLLINGGFSGQIRILRNGASQVEVLNEEQKVAPLGFPFIRYANSASITVELKQGDQIIFYGQHCVGCNPYAWYGEINVYQTITVFR